MALIDYSNKFEISDNKLFMCENKASYLIRLFIGVAFLFISLLVSYISFLGGSITGFFLGGVIGFLSAICLRYKASLVIDSTGVLVKKRFIGRASESFYKFGEADYFLWNIFSNSGENNNSTTRTNVKGEFFWSGRGIELPLLSFPSYSAREVGQFKSFLTALNSVSAIECRFSDAARHLMR